MTPIYARACCLPCGHGNEVAQAVTEPIGIAVGHVDLVFDAIKGESNGLRRVRAIDVVLKTRQNPGRHGSSFFPVCAR
jgi:hypothetical protein